MLIADVLIDAVRSRDQTDFAGRSGYPAGEFAPARNLSDDEAVKSLRAIVRTPQVRQALEHGNDTALCFVLRAVNRILSDDDQPNRTTINRLWDVLDEPELNRALGIKSRPGY
jgi:hypothetical protein